MVGFEILCLFFNFNLRFCSEQTLSGTKKGEDDGLILLFCFGRPKDRHRIHQKQCRWFLGHTCSLLASVVHETGVVFVSRLVVLRPGRLRSTIVIFDMHCLTFVVKSQFFFVIMSFEYVPEIVITIMDYEDRD